MGSCGRTDLSVNPSILPPGPGCCLLTLSPGSPPDHGPSALANSCAPSKTQWGLNLEPQNVTHTPNSIPSC